MPTGPANLPKPIIVLPKTPNALLAPGRALVITFLTTGADFDTTVPTDFLPPLTTLFGDFLLVLGEGLVFFAVALFVLEE
jgi:hypothetical protein